MLIHNEDYVYNVYFFIALISQKIDGSLEKKLKFPLITARGKSKKKSTDHFLIKSYLSGKQNDVWVLILTWVNKMKDN